MRGSAAFRGAITPGGVLAGPWVRDELWRRARAVPSLDLRFADNKSLVDATTGARLVDYTGASARYYTDSQGVLRQATLNLLVRSEELDNASWGKVAASISATQIASPIGTLTADEIIEDSATANHYVAQQVTLSNGLVYNYSVYVKAAQRSWCFVVANGTSTLHGISVNLSTGAVSSAVGSPSSIASVAIGNGWYRVSFSYTSGTSGGVGQEVRISTDGVWANRNYTGNGTGSVYAWGAQLEQSSTVGEYIPTTSTINSAPRFDHNPTTGESLGLLVEEARANSITNNMMVGAVAGTPGTLPTGWPYFAVSTGLTREIVGTGTENGITYIDCRISGTAGSTSPCELALNTPAAATGQVWTFSTCWRVAAGSTSGISSFELGQIELTSGGAFVAGAFVAQAAPTASALVGQRPAYTRTLSGGATVGLLASRIRITPVNGAAIDITLRIGLPQLEQGAFATSVIPTSGTAVTRAADVDDIINQAIANNIRTLFLEFRSPASGVRGAASLNDNTANNRAAVRTSGTDPFLTVADGGNTQADVDGGTVTANARTRVAVRIAANNFAISVNGGAAVLDTSGTVPTVDRLMIGRTQAGEYLNGPIARLIGWPEALPDYALEALSR